MCHSTHPVYRTRTSLLIVSLLAVVFSHGALHAEDLEDARELFHTGNYAECEAAVDQAYEEGSSNEDWCILKLRSQLAMGHYRDAMETVEAALEEHPRSIRLRWAGRPAWLFCNETDRADEVLRETDRLVRRSAWRYRDPDNSVVLGRFLLFSGADARQVLEAIYDRVKEEDPEFVEAYVASGDLALEKHDYAVAAQEFEQALKRAPDDPDILYRLARARAGGDPGGAGKYLKAALERNPNHIDSLLYLIDGAVDREAYDEARELIDRILVVHPMHPEALAYRAVLEHLAGDYSSEEAARAAALLSWPTNPEIDSLIGRKLSQKYRFAEGAARQRRALTFDRTYLPAKMQLCQDLMRLGREEEGWRLAREIYEEDDYNVVAHNLNALHDHLSGYHTLEAEGLIVRMTPHEAGIYGEKALDLLGRARKDLCAKYEVALEDPVVVEIFPEQKDFAIRTFGLPGGSGLLGVCFGLVITANSPASLGEYASSWQALLWHEFCHVVTLSKTRNKMPRWLSEGISVYEEQQANPAWGQYMTPQYLELIKAGGLVPVSRLSGAFLHPESPLHLQFAYYQSALVVEFLVARHGFDTLKGILSDLADGSSINKVLERHTGSLDELDRQFAAFAEARAGALDSKAEWDRPELPENADSEALASWVREHPNSFWGLQRYAQILLKAEQWGEARKHLDKLLTLCPEYTGPGNAYELLAGLHRRLSEGEAEREVLKRLSDLDADAVTVNLRLMELSTENGDWNGLALAAERLLAVNPLIKAPHRSLAQAMEGLGTPGEAIPSYRALLLMDPVDPAGLHYRLALALQEQGKLEESKRALLEAIEESPRFRDAYRELLAVKRLLDEQSEPEPMEEATEKRNP